jgi:tetratricopeptide (TPR) repeat protein
VRPGLVVASRFEVERMVASGGMGKVYRALDRATGAHVALKVVSPHDIGDERARFLREVRVLAELKHPAIVRYVAHGETPDQEAWLAMEWLEGETLRDRIEREPPTLEETLAVAQRVAEALAAAHARGIVHRDVKPGNILLADGNMLSAKLIDFGVVRVAGGDSMRTRTGVLVGTPQYMSPEQARGRGTIDARSDVFSLGCVVFKCLTLRAPFVADDFLGVLARLMLEEAPRVRLLRPDVPPAVEALVARMLSKDPELRPADGAAVVRELAVMQDATLHDRPEPAARALLGQAEQSVLSVLLAGPDADDESTAPPAAAPRSSRGPRFRDVVASFGARLERLRDGTLLVALAGKGSATDSAAAAAHCALAARARLAQAPMVLATGRGVVSESATVGEVIDRAVRLLRASAAPPDSVRVRGALPIRIDDVTGGLLDARFEVRSRGDALELVGVSPLIQTTRTLLGKPTPFVGREREMSMLLALYDECVSEPVARVALVTAPAGMGKSRLRQELLRRLAERGDAPTLIFGRGDAQRVGSPFGLLAPAIRASAGALEGEPVDAQRRKLEALVARNVAPAELRRVTAFVGELVGVPFPDDDDVQLKAARRDPMLMFDQVRRAWEDFVAAECGRRPLLIVLEDLHWGDRPSVQGVEAALRRLRDRPLMVVALARPEVHDVFPDLWTGYDVQPLPLAALTRRASEQLVREVLRERVGDDTVSRVVECAAGNAFYLEELIRAVADGKGDALPGTVLAMVQARLATLDHEARRVLRAASVFGGAFWAGSVAALLEGSGDIGDWLEYLCEHELLVSRLESKFPGEKEYAFRHALVREAAYSMLTEQDRARGHALAGAWLARMGERDAVLLADHFDRGGDSARAIERYESAAREALEANDLEGAISRARRGVDLGADGERLGALRLTEALAHQWRGEWTENEVSGRAAIELLRAGSRTWCQAAESTVFGLGKLGRYAELDQLIEPLRTVQPDDDARGAYAMALGRASWFLVHESRFDRARALMERIDDVVRPVLDHDITCAAQLDTIRAGHALFAGDSESCLHLSQTAIQRFEIVGDARAVSMQLTYVGDAYKELGMYERSVEPFREAISASQRMGLHIVTALAKLNLGVSLAHLGSFPDAITVAREAVDAFTEHGDHRLRVGARCYLARVLMLAGDLDGAERAARDATAIPTRSPPTHAHAHGMLAEILLRRGNAAEAMVAAAEAMRTLEEVGRIEEGEALVRLVYAEALEATGEHEAARRVLAAARNRLMVRAAKIRDPGMRASFLGRVRANARTIALARAWLGP